MTLENPSISERRLPLHLFALSFTALFLELMLIRWTPSVVRLVAYYANLLLLSSFLGLGIGAMLAGRRRLFVWFAPLLALDVIVLLAAERVGLPGSHNEIRFFAEQPRLAGYLLLVAIFAVNAALFIPLGQRIGAIFRLLPPLRAYAWDLLGSLAGTLCFALFSLKWFSPVIGVMIVMAIVMLLADEKRWLHALFFLPTIAIFAIASNRAAIWSPYYYITIRNATARATARGTPRPVPPPQLRTITDPPLYSVSVNQDFYQIHGTIDSARYAAAIPVIPFVRMLRDQYLLPYHIATGRERIAVLGAGGGLDVEAALLSGVKRVDAVEIDPVLVKLSGDYNAAAPYADPRVHVVVDDARAFLRRAEPGYDMVVFGFLDSQALFSSMSNVRLDGFTYTVESLRAAYRLLGKDGVMSVSFFAARPWLAHKLYAMVTEATGRAPIAYEREGQIILLSPRQAHAPPADSFGDFHRMALSIGGIDLATDDWPFLYLSKRTIPVDYLAVIGTLIALSAIVIITLSGSRFGASEMHFLLLGAGFLLLETKSIGDASLYFGTTWLVTTLVVAGVLLMVLASNVVAARISERSLRWYLPLLVALIVVLLTPRDLILGLPLGLRLAWTLAVMPLPIFFAGLIFSSHLKTSPDPAASFGANLMGAMAGGFSEYLGMLTGTRALGLVIVAAYLLSAVAARRSSRVLR